MEIQKGPRKVEWGLWKMRQGFLFELFVPHNLVSFFSCCAGPYQIKSKTDLGACFEEFHWIDFLHGLNKADFLSTHFFF